MKLPDQSAKQIKPIVLLSQYRDAGYILISHCSLWPAHQHIVVYDTLLKRLGDVEVNYAFKAAMTCPECGGPGGGMTLLPPGAKPL